MFKEYERYPRQYYAALKQLEKRRAKNKKFEAFLLVRLFPRLFFLKQSDILNQPTTGRQTNRWVGPLALPYQASAANSEISPLVEGNLEV